MHKILLSEILMVDTTLDDCSMNGRTVLKHFLMKENVSVWTEFISLCTLACGELWMPQWRSNFLSKLETFMTNWAIFSVWIIIGACRGSSRRDPGLISNKPVWNLWWTVWHRNSFFSEYFESSLLESSYKCPIHILHLQPKLCNLSN